MKPDFSKVHSDGRRGNRHKLKHEKFVLGIKKKKITMGAVKYWNMFPRKAVGCLFLEVFKTLVDIALTEHLDIITPALSRRVE